MKYTECGGGYRKALRHKLNMEGMNFKEDKGWFNSRFYISDKDYYKILPWLQQLIKINQK